MNKYTKYGIVAVGAVLITIGAVDWVFGALMQHDRVLIFLGAVVVAVAGFIHCWEKLQDKSRLPFLGLAASVFGATDVCAETIHAGTLTPPDTAPMLQWNSNAVLGPEFWAITTVVIVALGITCLYCKGYFD